MTERFISGLVLGVIVIFAIIYSPVCGMATTIFILIGLYEFFYMVEKKGVSLFKPFGLFVGGLIPITIYFRFPIKEGWQFLFVIIGLFLFFLIVINLGFIRRGS